MPHNKRRSLRARMITLVLFPSTVLLALWAAFTALLVGDIGELRTTATFTEQVGVPVEETISALQRERRATMDAAWGTERTALYLTYSRQRTDEAVDAFSQSLDAFDVQDLPEQALAFRAAVNRVDTLRARVDASSPTEIDLEETSTVYDEVIEQGLRVWDGQVERADPAQAPHLRSLTSLMRTRELLNQQDTVLAHAVATNSFPVQAHAQFAAAAGAQHYTWDRVVVEMSEEDSQDYIELESYTEVQRIYQLQESIISMPVRGGATVPVNATAWQGAAEAVDARMRDVEQGQIDRVIAFSRTQSAELRTSVLLVSVPALVAALVSSAVAVGATQRLGRRLQDLRTATLEHARVRLPEVTARLRAGGSVDVDAEVPRLRVESTDEVGQVAEAFNDAQRAAVAAAVEEAQVRAGVRNMFRNIARRTQALVHRQLGLLDALERAETDPKVLESLFRIDHFSTQMRRNAENLMLLSGDAPVRRGLAPVRLHEAVRAAASEIEDYVRVRVLAVPAVALRGEVGADTVRLLAELLENATSFSPPGTEVTVSGRAGEAGGCVLEVRDRGLGMTREQLEASNALLRDPPRFDLARMREDSQLGLFVVATIAARHGLEVTLSAGPERGTCAVVAVPADALAAEDAGGAEPGGGREAAPAQAAERSRPLVLTGGPPAETGGVQERAAREGGDRTAPETPDAAADGDGEDTYKGLPRRRRKGLRPSPAPAPAAPGEPGGREAAAERSLTEIRSMMSAFQSGSLRGRAQPLDGDGDGVRGARPGESSEG
ncbi:nitrate- and nitrite sensing domain-containing protein [Nocardiopsis dassonvillei]|uniref:sensor histidine kinase n=1 Tax=Nocardiopsis dassonvillei TaxID=2014 RepID=UPI00102B22F8|nr:nitrate- and nitrite sensing domain-containing protein [Nocardiopsis dassonvillei]MCP3012559.1 nitrate- and nitrite sensing domain-containing protein [Nocardiopsis dassonvillei]